MSDPNEIPSVSMANTKKDLLDAYQAAKDRAEALGKNLLDAEKARKRMEKQLAEATADTQAGQDPLKRLQDLRSGIGRELTDLAERYEAEIDAYRKIKAAVADKSRRCGPSTKWRPPPPTWRPCLTPSGWKRSASKRRRMRPGRRSKRRCKARGKRGSVKRPSRSARAPKPNARSRPGRKREKEDYEYALFAGKSAQRKKRPRRRAEPAWKRRSPRKRRPSTRRSASARPTWRPARRAAARMEEELVALRKAAEAFPASLDKAVKQAVDAAGTRLTRDFEKDKALLESCFEGEKNVRADSQDRGPGKNSSSPRPTRSRIFRGVTSRHTKRSRTSPTGPWPRLAGKTPGGIGPSHAVPPRSDSGAEGVNRNR